MIPPILYIIIITRPWRYYMEVFLGYPVGYINNFLGLSLTSPIQAQFAVRPTTTDAPGIPGVQISEIICTATTIPGCCAAPRKDSIVTSESLDSGR